ncbi:MAG: 50S ribosomal protein L6 [Betaproteobacteria bacterium TMED156]|nr:MAG: 50S ribosomal protein L6 [Betaproteobacteria bacterium TMED156]|tara:strand:- start:248 stop:784 length:537 start_codon:yes stop_codon:yes gene_type:complete
MSRIAKMPIEIPQGTKITINNGEVLVDGPKGKLSQKFSPSIVLINADEKQIHVRSANEKTFSKAMSGTIRALLANMVKGVNEGFEKKLSLVGVGYRAQAKGNVLDLSLGFSHPVNMQLPNGINVKTPSPTEIIISGINKQQVGQIASEVRGFRPPEPYKGKGVRYSDEVVSLKETKKK